MTTTASYRKSIEYDPETRDFRMMLDGELVGFERSYHRAEITLDQLVFELISGEYFTQKRIYPAKFPPACPSCGDAVREAGPLAACREAGENLDAVADCAAGNTDRIDPELSANDVCPLAFTCEQCGQTKDEGQFTLSAIANLDAMLCNICIVGYCFGCGQPHTALGIYCATCADTGHRCSEGHALEDSGACETCGDIEDADQARLRDAEADDAEPWEADLVRALTSRS